MSVQALKATAAMDRRRVNMTLWTVVVISSQLGL